MYLLLTLNVIGMILHHNSDLNMIIAIRTCKMILINIIDVIICENDYQLDYECKLNTTVSLNAREFTKIKIDGSLNIDLVSLTRK